MKSAPTIILIADDVALRSIVKQVVQENGGGGELVVTGSFDRAESLLENAEVPLVIIHRSETVAAAKVEQFLDLVAAGQRKVAAIVITESDCLKEKLSFIQRNALDCLSRPLNITRLAFLYDLLAARWTYSASLLPKPAVVEQESHSQIGDGKFIFTSPVMQKLVGQARRIAASDATVLITGETGTGKTQLSQIIHDLSDRSDSTFAAINCGAMASSLIESELFGHSRGAFTGAHKDHIGKLAAVGDGTLLLDEIDSLPLEAQGKLLRAVEERTFDAIGAEKASTFEARLIVATSRSLKREVELGRFREDLYYRFNVISLQVPPLRERPEEVGALIDRFLTELKGRRRLTLTQFSPAAVEIMRQYDWPGNVRELRNVVERTAVLCSRKIAEIDDLPDEIRGPLATPLQASGVASQSLTGNRLAAARTYAEEQSLREALHSTRNNRSRAASELGISRTALYKKLKKFGIA